MHALVLATALLASLPLAVATHDEGCVPGQAFTTGEFAGFHVMLFFGLDGGTTVGVWQETNDIAGLQMFSEVADHTCGGHYAPDTEIFAFFML